ncbi:ABC transporter substrate-binding protein [Candidatus Poriferisodalis sp.]|uniref:ABC transporter substrate-binding protein n=1 Tax=Candidatus Poriferisodalis sp. TaxID=3101277 RepID=UPI003B018339
MSEKARWLTRMVALFAALALFVSACGDDADEQAADDTAAPTEQADDSPDAAADDPGDDPDAGDSDAAADDAGDAGDEAETDDSPAPPTGTIVVGRAADIDVLDPHRATAFQSVQALELVYDTLLSLGADLAVGPGLAESWEFSADGRTLTLHLREGVMFHGGDSFDSGDAAASLNRILDEETGAVTRANIASIASVDTPDASTVVLNLSQADAPILASLADLNAAMMSADAIATGTVDTSPDGTGPFVWGEWQQGESLTLTANLDHWRGAPQVGGIEIRVLPDEASLLAAVDVGEVNVAVITDPLVAVQAGGDVEVLRTPALAYHALMMNSNRGPLADQSVRHAISCAINRQEVIDSAALGEGAVTGPITIPAYQSPPDGLPCGGQQDVAEARRLLDAAGQGAGFELNVIVPIFYASAVDEAQVVQAQLGEVGIALDLEVLETDVYVERWLAADFDAAVALNSGKIDPHQMYVRYWTSDGNLNPIASYSSDILDELMAAGRVETDQSARVRIYAEFSAALQEASPWIWIYNGFEYRMLNGVDNFTPMPTGSLQFLREASLVE